MNAAILPAAARRAPWLAALARSIRAQRRALLIALLAAGAAAGCVALHGLLRSIRWDDIRLAIVATPPLRIGAALLLTAIGYLALTGYDAVALALIGRPQPWRVAATASFTSYALSHTLGLALLTGGSARYRVYAAAGLNVREVAAVQMIASGAFWAGMAAVVALALIVTPTPILLGGLAVPPAAARLIGAGVLAALALLPFGGRLGLRAAPAGKLALLGGVAIVDLLAAGAVLFVLVPGLGPGALPAFLLAYALAIAAGAITHVPGGIGVFEAVMLTVLPHDRPALVAALLLYRIVYYLLPLLLAAVLVTVAEGARLRRPIAGTLTLIDRAARALAPGAATLLVFAGGFVLLVSGALPGVEGRLGTLDALLPLPLLEGSHLAASLAGTALLLTAPALNARMANGFHAARALLVGGALFSLLKGLDYEEAAAMLSVAALLHYSRRAFYRKGGLLTEPIDWAWIAAALGAIALRIWAGFDAYQRTPYSNQLWWQFAWDGNAPRFLRASFGAGVMLSGAIAWRLLLRSRAPDAPAALPPAVAARAFAAAERSDANLAFTGDKRFAISATGDAFLMYRIQGRSWIVMGDPVGPRGAWHELVWAARRECDAARGRLCFFQASEAMLPLFVDLGLSAIKYGEEAHIPLAGFTVAGAKGKALRHGRRRALAAGLRFEIVPAADVPALLPELRTVSDAWLRARGAREKRFSLGCFSAAYLARFDCAIVRDGAQIVAFANVWRGAQGRELSVDLMRHVPDAPYGTMDYLFVELLEWGRAAGFERFNLGVAPLSGIVGGSLAPRWAKLARLLFENGERFYGFAGLRAFKNKFDPLWCPRYIAAPPGWALGRTLIDVLAAVSARV